MNFKTSCLILGLCLIVSVSAGEDNKDDVTVKFLNQLNDFYSSKGDDKNFQTRSRKVQAMIIKDKDSKCDPKNIANALELIEDDADILTDEIKSSYEQYKESLVDECGSAFDDKLKQELEKVSEKDKKKINQIRESIVSLNDGQPIIPTVEDQKIKEGILAFMEKETAFDMKKINDKKAGQNYFTGRFKKEVGSVCDSIKKQVSATRVYKRLMRDPDVFSKLNPSSHNWLANASICTKLQKNTNFASATFVALSKRRS